MVDKEDHGHLSEHNPDDNHVDKDNFMEHEELLESQMGTRADVRNSGHIFDHIRFA